MGYKLLWLCLFIPLSIQASPSKKTLLTLYKAHPFTFISQTPFNAQGKAYTHLCEQCPTQEVNIQWVHVVSSKSYLSNKMCYQEKICLDAKNNRFGGVSCCRKKDMTFKQFENDLHHIVPELPTLKKLVNQYSISKNEPSQRLKGTIARMFLYMELKYKIGLSKSDKAHYQMWHAQYAPSEWEKKRNKLIKDSQGDANPYIY